MKFNIEIVLSLFGAVAFFLFGMKVISQSLQKVAGAKMRDILELVTANKYKGFFTGFLITGIIQSSSATTVLTVSLVNAGLIDLAQSIPLILGANVGTTVTAWLVSTLGYHFKLSSLALPIIALAFPLIFSSKVKRQYLGEFIIGFSILFISIGFINNLIPNVQNNPDILNFLKRITDSQTGGFLIFVLIGFLITAIFQSSSATSALTIVMSFKGWIDFPLAAAMILGENIGTTITANIAALIANMRAKQAAFSHFLVNLFGVIWMLILLKPFIFITDSIVMLIENESVYTSDHATPIGIAVFHTLFNVVNAGFLMNFIPAITRLIQRIIPDKSDSKSQLKYISTGLLSTSELSLIQARKIVAEFGIHIQKMFRTAKEQFNETNEERFYYLYDSVSQMETYSDSLEIDIARYLNDTSLRELSKNSSGKIILFLKLIGHLENVGDTINEISKTLKRRKKKKVWFTQEFRNGINELFDMIEKSLKIMNENIHKNAQIDFEECIEIKKEINKFRKKLLKDHLSDIEDQNFTYQAGVFFSDILNHCDYLSSNIFHISETIFDYYRDLEN